MQTQSTAVARALDSGMLMVAVAALLFACKGTLIKYIYALGATVDDVMILRLLFAIPIYAWVALREWPADATERYRPAQWLGVAGCGIFGYYISSYLDMMGLQTVSAGLERMILYTYPAFVVLLSSALFRKPVSLPLCLCIAVIYCGLGLVFYADIQLQPKASLAAIGVGATYVLLCAMAFAVYVVGSEHYMRVFSSRLFTAVAMLAAGVGMSMHYALFNSLEHLLQLSNAIYGWCLLTALVFTVVPAFMMSAGVSRIGSAKAGAVGMVGPVATVLVAATFLGEAISAAQIAGLVVVILGVRRLHKV